MMRIQDVDRNNFTQIEQYADEVIIAILETSNNDRNTMIDLFSDHIIIMINPDYFKLNN